MSKLAFRTDRAAGVVRCFISELDDSERTEIATMSLALLERIPDLFDRWVVLMRDAYKTAFEEATGLKVAGFHDFRPHDKN
jgi:hypothetical protein